VPPELLRSRTSQADIAKPKFQYKIQN